MAGTRRGVIIYALCLGTGLLLAIGWYGLLPFYRPALRAGEMYGIDVSSHQQPLDWRKAYADDVRFVYVKATEGSGWQDPAFKEHWQGARAAGLRTGAYHYFSLCSPGKTQAANFLKRLPKDDDMLPPVLDLEFSPFCPDMPKDTRVWREIDDYIGRVRAATKRPVLLYVGDDFDRQYDIRRHYGDTAYWQLRYLRRPADDRDKIWQAGNFFFVAGAKGMVDLNVADLDTLYKL